MPTFEIEQYELYSQRFTVEAADEAEAVKKLHAGRAEAMDDTLELIEVADDRGMRIAEHPSLVKRLRILGVEIGTNVIPSIRSIERMD